MPRHPRIISKFGHLPNLVSITQTARLLNVPETTVHLWDEAGVLKSVRTGKHGLRHYHRADVLELLTNARNSSTIRHLSSLELLNRLAGLLNSISASLDSKALANTVAKEAAELLAAPRAGIYLIDESGTRLEALARVDRDDPARASRYSNSIPLLAQPLFEALLTETEPIWVSDTYADIRTTREFFDKFNTRALLLAPLRTRTGQTFGCLGFFWTSKIRLFSEEEIIFAKALAAQTATNLENSRLYKMLQSHTARLETILDSAAQGIMVYDSNSRIVYANAQLSALYEMHAAEIIGLYSWELAEKLKPQMENPQEGDAIVARVNNPELGFYTEEFNLLTPYPRTLRRLVAPVKDSAGAYLGKVALYQDLTEERAIARAKDDFIKVAAHELKTPLTVLSSYSQLLTQRLLREESKALDVANTAAGNTTSNVLMARQIQEQALRMRDMIEDLLDVTRLSSGTRFGLRNFDFVAMVERVVEQLRTTTSEHSMTLTVPDNFPRTYRGESRRLEQVVRNLLENAIKYSPLGGIIAVELNWQSVRAEKGGYIQLKVHDQGIGIAKEYQTLLFNRFYRTPTAQEVASGLGLGLSICAEIVYQHKGQLEVESEGENKGSTFILTLPLEQD